MTERTYKVAWGSRSSDTSRDSGVTLKRSQINLRFDFVLGFHAVSRPALLYLLIFTVGYWTHIMSWPALFSRRTRGADFTLKVCKN